MAGHCFLLSLPGELRNSIYDAIYALEGITLIGDRTQVHPLGRTCHHLHREVLSRTSAYAEKDVQVTVSARIYDFGFQYLQKWLMQHPCPSDSLAGLPYKGEPNRNRFFATPVRRARLHQQNLVAAMSLGVWSVDRHAEINNKFGVPEHSPDRPARLDLYHRETECSCLVEFTVEVQEPLERRYARCWPKPRPEVESYALPTMLPTHGAFKDDFLAASNIAGTHFWVPGDLEDNASFRDILTLAQPTVQVREHVPTIALYDRKLFEHLKSNAVRKWTVITGRKRLGNPNNLKCITAKYFGRDEPRNTMKREAEEDQGVVRKRRAGDVAGWNIERAWRVNIERTSQSDMDMLSAELSGMRIVANPEE
ncbi:hypothetical protein LTR95_010248 [Oleoguttula sp. CCFEE 5521]